MLLGINVVCEALHEARKNAVGSDPRVEKTASPLARLSEEHLGRLGVETSG